MRLSLIPLVSYQNNNSFRVASEWEIRSGEANTLYFQLVDLDQDKIRYMAASGATMTVNFPGVDGNLTKTALVANALDPSIWSVSLLSTDIFGSGNIQIILTEGASVKKAWAYDVLSVEPGNPGGCNCACGGGCGGDC